MKKKSVFFWILLMVITMFICVSSTLILALLAGSMGNNIIDFSNINLFNFVAVVVVGGINTLFIFIILLIFLLKSGTESAADFIKKQL